MTTSITPSYYMQVKAIVSPVLTDYREDLTALDRKMLRGYTGEFIHSSRATGTDLALFGSIDCMERLDLCSVFCLRDENTLYLHGLNGVVRVITQDEAAAVFERRERVMSTQLASDQLKIAV